jgi:hypothetical protein
VLIFIIATRMKVNNDFKYKIINAEY